MFNLERHRLCRQLLLLAILLPLPSWAVHDPDNGTIVPAYVHCIDEEGWLDAWNQSCAFYDLNSTMCDTNSKYTDAVSNSTANEACCACRSLTCSDLTDSEGNPWKSSDGVPCADYPEFKCADFGDVEGTEGYTANEACCSCRYHIVQGTGNYFNGDEAYYYAYYGGYYIDDMTDMYGYGDDAYNTANGTAPFDPEPVEATGESNGPDDPEGNYYEYTLVDNGGGSKNSPPKQEGGCVDDPQNWTYIDEETGDASSCSDYSMNEWCEDFGGDEGVDGHTANVACCACGGGSQREVVVGEKRNDEAEKEGSGVGADAQGEGEGGDGSGASSDSDGCVDEPWEHQSASTDDLYTCKHYVENEWCNDWGKKDTNEAGVTASRACCGCGGGIHTRGESPNSSSEGNADDASAPTSQKTTEKTVAPSATLRGETTSAPSLAPTTNGFGDFGGAVNDAVRSVKRQPRGLVCVLFALCLSVAFFEISTPLL